MLISKTTANIINNFSSLCVPTRSKVDFLMGSLKEFDAKFISCNNSTGEFDRYSDAGVLIPSKVKAKKLIISHIDLINLFETGFVQNRRFSINIDTNGFSKIEGALDNGITNAVLYSLIKEKGSIPPDVEILFSLGEESGLTGVSEFLSQKDKSYFEDLFVINLDVTNDNFGLDGSVEFDYADPAIFDEISEKIPSVGLTTNRFCDDTDAVLSFTQSAMSFCLPTDNYCHTYQSYALLSSLEGYYNALETMVYSMSFNYDKNRASEFLNTLQKENNGVVNPFCFK